MNDQKTPEKKQLKLMRIQTVMIGVILLLILALVVFLALKVNEVMAIVVKIDPEQLNAAVGSLRAAADRLAQVDVESLNQGIRGLSEAAGKLSELDFEKLNSFMDSLESMGRQMDAVSGLLKGFLRK